MCHIASCDGEVGGGEPTPEVPPTAAGEEGGRSPSPVVGGVGPDEGEGATSSPPPLPGWRGAAPRCQKDSTILEREIN